MSWDVSIEAFTGKHWDEVYCVGNMTSNVHPMYTKAFNLQDGFGKFIHESDCSDLIPILEAGIKYMEKYKKEMLALNPSNGWGDYDSALKFLQRLWWSCKEYPDCRVSCWY